MDYSMPSSLSFTNSRSLLKLMSTESVIQPSHPLPSPSPLAFNLSQHQGLFWWVGPSHQVAKYWSFSFNVSLSNEYSGLISFRINWFELLAVQGTLQSLLQHDSSKASILRCSAFFMMKLTSIYAAAAAAKSRQSCPTLCDPIDNSPPGSPVPGILQARTLE